MLVIPEDWINQYVDRLLRMGHSFHNDSLMRAEALSRVEYVMDMVKAYKVSVTPPQILAGPASIDEIVEQHK